VGSRGALAHSFSVTVGEQLGPMKGARAGLSALSCDELRGLLAGVCGHAEHQVGRGLSPRWAEVGRGLSPQLG